MDSLCDIPIPYRIMALTQERNRFFAYPLEQLAGEIKATGFRCTRCGTCCSRIINRHIFLLDCDVARAKKIDPAHLNLHRTLNSATRMVHCMYRDMRSG
ncbi:MAG: hypothetical protein NTZ39_11600 [Methanoregula sp.]|nr:hypothetical protein [Methanoregula sp.]